MFARLPVFLKFTLLSGAGWLCDMVTFVLLVNGAGIPAAVANIISSFVGVTFVWFTSVGMIFGRKGARRWNFLAAYWLFQLASILCYSQFLHAVMLHFATPDMPARLAGQAALAAKIFVTPFNLVTNFLFMRFLTRFMEQTTQSES
jgi:putative flippase GtrA